MSREAAQEVVVPAADGTSLKSSAQTLQRGFSAGLQVPPCC